MSYPIYTVPKPHPDTAFAFILVVMLAAYLYAGYADTLARREASCHQAGGIWAEREAVCLRPPARNGR